MWQERFLSIIEQCIPKGVCQKKEMFPGDLKMSDASYSRKAVHTNATSVGETQCLDNSTSTPETGL